MAYSNLVGRVVLENGALSQWQERLVRQGFVGGDLERCLADNALCAVDAVRGAMLALLYGFAWIGGYDGVLLWSFTTGVVLQRHPL